MNKWQKVWNRKGSETAIRPGLADLLARDGFDSGPGSIDEATWQRYAAWVVEKLELTTVDRVLEVGCGAGAFLYEIARHSPHVSGTDFSETLIEVAKQAIPDGVFTVAEARDLESQTASYDVVLANSVFQYFPDFTYAQDVVTAMTRSATRAIALLDVYDAGQREAMASLKRRFLGVRGFQQKYEGLEHLYFERAWFEKQAGVLGWAVEVFDQPTWLCDVSQYRFNVIMRRRGAEQ